MALNAEWIQLDPGQKIAPRRSGHASFGRLDYHYIFGGYAEEDSVDGGVNRYVTNDLWRWRDGSWQAVQHSGDSSSTVPRPRLVAASAIVKEKAYVFGGWDPGKEKTGGEILETVEELDLSTNKWKQLDELLPDGPSSRHVAVTFGDKVLIHNHRCEGFVWIFDPVSGRFAKQETSGPCPSSRGLHAACLVGDNKVVLFGGAAKDQTMSNEVFVLSTDGWEWRRIAQDAGFGPSPRAAPSICAYDEECIVVFGGAEATNSGLNPRGDAWALHLEDERWELLLDDDGDDDRRPAPRNAASLALIKTSDSGKDFLLTGGWHPFVRTHDDCFVLRIS